MNLFPSHRTTPLPGGYMGKILRVDLTTGTLKDENLPEEPILKKFIGGQALAFIYFNERVAARRHAVRSGEHRRDHDRTADRQRLHSRRHENDRGLLEPADEYDTRPRRDQRLLGNLSQSRRLRRNYSNGASPKPVYLYIKDGKAELRDAAQVWGAGTRDTEDRLREIVGNRDARVLCIGPAGENMNRAAMLANDYNHFAAHSGGAVLGSKKLKAIVVSGTLRPSYRDKAKLADAGLRWRNVLQQHDVKKKKTKYGHGDAWGALNNLNWRSTDIQPAHIKGFDQNEVVLRPCFQCARMCPWDAKLGEGEFKGTVVHFNAGGEWLDTFFNLGIKGNAVLYLAEKINNLGIECSHFSCGAGVAFEAWEKGLLGPDRTNGLKLEWGNVEAVDKLLDMAARREGWLGNLLAEGPKQLAEALGGDAPQLGGPHQRRHAGDARVAPTARSNVA